MVSVERPSEIGTPQWNGPQQRQLHFALDPAEVEAYSEKGFLILRDVFQPTEIETYRQEAEQIVARAFALSHEFQLEPKYNLRFEVLADGQPWKIDPFVSISPLFSALARDRRIMDRLASLYDGYEAVLFKDKLIFKPPDSHGNGLHQDYNWWQGFPHSLLTVSVALDASTKENGCTELWTGHHQGFLHEPGSLDKGSIDPEHLANEEHVYVDLAPGDMAILPVLRHMPRHLIHRTVLGECCSSAITIAEMANTTPPTMNTFVGTEPAQIAHQKPNERSITFFNAIPTEVAVLAGKWNKNI